LTDAENLSGDRFKTVDLIPMIENCVHTLMSVNPQAQVDLNLELESALMTADPDLIELAIMNILENAVKYSEPPARVEVSVKKVDQQVHLQIKDHGIGISERDLPHVFERFYTVDKARSRKAGGAGLGLAIVKTIIEKHKGKILLSSELGKGSTFILLLPLDRKILPQ
jgi:two-component system phosphate regulon sensor histidine kinase PhoR